MKGLEELTLSPDSHRLLQNDESKELLTHCFHGEIYDVKVSEVRFKDSSGRILPFEAQSTSSGSADLSYEYSYFRSTSCPYVNDSCSDNETSGSRRTILLVLPRKSCSATAVRLVLLWRTTTTMSKPWDARHQIVSRSRMF
jgi:hypothetical protein